MTQQPLVGQEPHDHTSARHTTLGRTYLDKWPARRRDPYLTNPQESSVPQAAFETAVATSERAETHSLDRVATRIGDRDL